MSETARTYRNIYVGGSLEDLKDQPDFESAGFDPESKAARNTSAFGKTAGPEAYFIVVTGKKHSLVQDGQQFVGSTDLSLLHELLHPSQIIRELAEGGHASPDSEPRTQMREQTIAEELGKKPGQDFPDVIGSGVPYRVQLDSPEAQPNSAPRGDLGLPVDPMKYEGDTGSPVLRALEKYRRSAAPDGPAPISSQSALPATPASQPYTAGTGGVLGKFIWDNPIAPAEAAPSLAQGVPLLMPYFPDQASAFGDRSGNASDTPSPDTYPQLRRISPPLPRMTLPDPDQPVPPQPGSPLGIFTGKPMPSWTTPPPLGGLLNNSSASGNGDLVDFLMGLQPRNPAQPEPQQAADSIPERRLGRRTYNVPASVFDTSAPAVPLAPSADANYPGGLPDMLAAPAGSDPNRPAPPDDEQEQADLQALAEKLSSSGSINDAWALYKARLAGRR